MKIAAIILLALTLFSCRSTRTNKDFKHIVVDSTEMVREDSSGVQVDETVNVTSEEETNEWDFSGDFVVDPAPVDEKDEDDPGRPKPEDYLPTITIDSAGSVVITGPIKSFRMKGKATNKIVDSPRPMTSA
jgi:hypothetical protein